MHALQRVMPSAFFILQRQFVRVDRVVIRLIETRVFHKSAAAFLPVP